MDNSASVKRGTGESAVDWLSGSVARLPGIEPTDSEPREAENTEHGRPEMANHGTHTKTAKQRARHQAKPSRQKRLERRWDERVASLREYLSTRDYAFRVGPFVSRVWPHRNDVGRVFRIAEYLAKRAERPSAKQAKAA